MDGQMAYASAARGWKTHFAKALGIQPAPLGRSPLLADAELRNHGLITLRVVLLQIVEQATAPADHHQKPTTRAVILEVRFKMVRQLTDALAEQRNLNFRTPGVGGMRAIRVNHGLLLFSG